MSASDAITLTNGASSNLQVEVGPAFPASQGLREGWAGLRCRLLLQHREILVRSPGNQEEFESVQGGWRLGPEERADGELELLGLRR